VPAVGLLRNLYTGVRGKKVDSRKFIDTSGRVHRVTLLLATRQRVQLTHRSSDIVAPVTGVRYKPLRLDTRLLPEDFS